jgi:predicted solute-binding protein
MSVDNSLGSYMREYRERRRLKEDNLNNVSKRTKLPAERQREYAETKRNSSAEYMRNYRKRKSSGRTQEYTTHIYTNSYSINFNQVNEYFQKNVIGNPFG